MIDGHHALSANRQAQLAGISRGSVYYLPKPISAADLALMHRIDALHLEHPFMVHVCGGISLTGTESLSGASMLAL